MRGWGGEVAPHTFELQLVRPSKSEHQRSTESPSWSRWRRRSRKWAGHALGADLTAGGARVGLHLIVLRTTCRREPARPFGTKKCPGAEGTACSDGRRKAFGLGVPSADTVGVMVVVQERRSNVDQETQKPWLRNTKLLSGGVNCVRGDRGVSPSCGPKRNSVLID